MTAVASPPSVQSLPRWSSGNGTDGLESMSAEEVTRMFMPRKSIQRQKSASSVSSAASSSSTGTTVSASAPLPHTNGDHQIANGDQGGYIPRKKAARGLWPSSSSKSEPVSGISIARPQALATPSSGQSAASTMNSAMHQQTSLLPSQIRAQPGERQQNGARTEQGTSQGDGTAILALLPMTGTFERKQIVVPFFPDTLRIGRQTNAKTLPTAVNGYFDSKVLSRQHAEVWADRNGKIWIRDVKSSNGTFVNGQRLSPENRESEPHEVREQDTLELGIDIVSEDQKSIVHHKVSAKVELAGMYSNTPSLLDMMHLDPNTGQPFQGQAVGQQISQTRGRAGSQGSIGSNGRLIDPPSAAGPSGGMMGAQRQMNMWMGPITIEQVVRKLTTELRQAKGQSHDLHRTSDFFTALMTLEPGKEAPKSPREIEPERKAVNGVSAQNTDILMSPDPLSPFTQPPMPPPSQPLPEKPESSRSFSIDPVGQPVRRADTEKSSPTLHSPTKMESQNGQVFSLLEALKLAKQESNLQGDRIKNLELALKRERRARATAERRARAFSGAHQPQTDNEDGAVEETAHDPPLDSTELIVRDLPNGHVEGGDGRDDVLRSSTSTETLMDPSKTRRETEEIDASTSRLQARLDLMNKEMDEMKTAMESYKRRAEDAEEGRRSLAEMVDNIRAGREPQNVKELHSEDSTLIGSDNNGSDSSSSRGLSKITGGNHGLWTAPNKRQMPNSNVSSGDMQRELERTLFHVLQQQRPSEHGRIAQSAPYISMVGVVLIGVGIMTWLNGWQPGGDSR